MAGTRPWFIAVASVALAAGCGSMQSDYPGIPPSNATVARVLMQAPGAALMPGAPVGALEPVATSPATPAAGDRTDKRDRAGTTATVQKSKPAARGASSAAPATAAASERPRTAGGTVAPQYRYLVELDRGGWRSFDFAADQKLRVGDRVFVTDGGTLNVH